MTASDDPAENLDTVSAMLSKAAAQGAGFVATPEVTNCVSTSRAHQRNVLEPDDGNSFLTAMQAKAQELGLWLLLGSLAVKTDDPDGRFANRSFLIDPQGQVAARYDKIHMFDVEIDSAETYRESSGYRPGQQAVIARTPFATLGLSICYDMRFPQLYQALARAGAQVLTAPSAFSPVTGAAHWHALLRARAIETGCYVIAPAQTGTHPARHAKPRQTFGHSLAVSPWGEVLLDAGTEPGVHSFDLSLENVEDARRRIPALRNAQEFHPPS
jgi:predicted amidohydrolase